MGFCRGRRFTIADRYTQIKRIIAEGHFDVTRMRFIFSTQFLKYSISNAGFVKLFSYI